MGKEEFKNPHPELPVREPILKLGKMITDRVPIKLGFEKLTADSPEYWGLAPICTDEQANIALKMGVRKPKTLKQMVQEWTRKNLKSSLSRCLLMVFWNITGKIHSTRSSMFFQCSYQEVLNLLI